MKQKRIACWTLHGLEDWAETLWLDQESVPICDVLKRLTSRSVGLIYIQRNKKKNQIGVREKKYSTIKDNVN